MDQHPSLRFNGQLDERDHRSLDEQRALDLHPKISFDRLKHFLHAINKEILVQMTIEPFNGDVDVRGVQTDALF